jgi:hypothetical protein
MNIAEAAKLAGEVGAILLPETKRIDFSEPQPPISYAELISDSWEVTWISHRCEDGFLHRRPIQKTPKA